MVFRVELESFRGPLDLLVYLVRRHEIEPGELQIGAIVDQFLAWLETWVEVDVNLAADFLELSSTLLELKSRAVLPHGGEEETPLDAPREDLVRRLLEYKQYRDAASILEERARAWQDRFPRLDHELPPRERVEALQPIRELELWDLVSAYARVVRSVEATRPQSILYDDTPIHVFMERIRERIGAEGELAFSEMLLPEMHKSTLVGLFLAVLELVRSRVAAARQEHDFGEIWVVPREVVSEPPEPDSTFPAAPAAPSATP